MRAFLAVIPLALVAMLPCTRSSFAACEWIGEMPRPFEQSPEIRVVFVSFPDRPPDVQPNCTDVVGPLNNDLPAWADNFAVGFEQYLAWVSNGRFTPNVEVLRHSIQNPLTENWRADHPSTHYQYECGSGSPDYGDLHSEIIAKAYAENSTAWSGVDALLFVHFEDVFHLNPNLRGVGNLGLPATFDPTQFGFPPLPPGSIGKVPAGAAVMLVCSELQNGPNDVPDRIYRGAAHEFGHTLGLGHSPQTELIANNRTAPAPPVVCDGSEPLHAIQPEFVNLGIYGATIRNAHPEPVADPGLVAYHPMDLGEALRLEPLETRLPSGEIVPWLPVLTVAPTPCWQTVTVPLTRDPNADYNLVKVTIPASDQYFLLANHTNTGPLAGADARYGASGLLIWHVWPSSPGAPGDPIWGVWDLESAAGKFTPPPGASGSADPNTWWDPLEASVCHMGSAADFFGPATSKVNFGPNTNPNTNLYSTTYQAQSVPSGLNINNIRPSNDGSGSFLVDIAIAQFGIEGLASGRRYTWRETIDLDWAICGDVTDVLRSNGNGASFALIGCDSPDPPECEDNVPNDGTISYLVPPGTPSGSNYKFRIIPDNTPNMGVDSSPLTFWTMNNVSVTRQVEDGDLHVNVQWTTSHASNANDLILLSPPSTTNFTPFSLPASGTSHAHTVSMPCEVGMWEYALSSSYAYAGPPAGLSWVSTYSMIGQNFQTFVVTSCSPPPPHCPPHCIPEGSSRRAVDDAGASTGVPAFLRPTANPFRHSTELRFGLTHASRVDLVLVDIAGRVVRTLVSSELEPGEHHAHWDGLDERGGQVPAGLYMARLRLGDQVLTAKLFRVY